MNIKELVASIEIELEAAEQRELRARKEMELLLVTAQQEMRSDLSPEDDSRFASLKETVQNARVDQASIKRKLAKARQVQADEARTDDDLEHATAPEGLPRTATRTASVSVGREERTYHRGNDPTGKMFLNDIVKQYTTNDVRAAGRLQQHMREEMVDRAQQGQELRAGEVGTGAFSGLVVPQYLVDMVAPHVANLRPFADICNKHPLPASGMSLNISRITTASKVELQTSENAAQATPTAMDDTLLTINVQTALGQQTISRQAIERGYGIEDVVMQDLFRQHATLLDSTMLNAATHGLTNVANNVSGVATVADLAHIYPAILGAASQSETATLGMAHPTYAIMHPRRWFWLQSLLTTQWPAFTQPGVDPRAEGTNTAAPYNTGVHGVLPSGLKVVTDANILTNGGTATNQDEIYVVPDVECHLWEDQGNPVYIRAEQPAAASLGVLLVVYSYFAFTYERYTNATQKVTGLGLAAPSGF